MNLLERFDLDQQRRGLQPSTIDQRHGQIELFGSERLPKAKPEQIQQWLDARRTHKGLPISDKTRSCYLTTFSAFFKWAIKHDHLKFNPIEKLDRPRVHPGMPNPISEADLDRAIKGCKIPMLKCWIVLEAYAGLRCQEVAYLALEDVQVPEDRIYVRRGKGGQQRYLSGIHPMILDALKHYKAPTKEGRLWPSATPASVSQRINRYYHGLGITHTAHKNRHRFGTRHLKAGANLIATQHALGHKNVATTQIYAGIDDSEVRKGVMGL